MATIICLELESVSINICNNTHLIAPHNAANETYTTPIIDPLVLNCTATERPRTIKNIDRNVLVLNVSIFIPIPMIYVQIGTVVFNAVYKDKGIYNIDKLLNAISADVKIPMGTTSFITVI